MRKLGIERLNVWLFEKPVRNSFLVTGLFFCCFFLIFHPRFDTNDDVRQAMIASGVGITDSPDAHILFPHIYLGELLSTAYSTLPTIPWYGFMLYAALFVGVWMAVYVLLKKRKKPWPWLLWAILPLSINIQYTGVAFMLTMGGVFAGMSLLGAQKKDRTISWQLLFPLALLFASLIRWEAFLLAFGLMGITVFLNRTERQRGGELIFYAGVMVLALGFLLHGVHNHHYDNEPGWQDFRSHNALRGEITDYNHIPFNEKTASLYEEIGWTESAFQLYQSWFLADEQVHSLEKLEELNASKKWIWRFDSARLYNRLRTLPSQNLFAGLLLIPLLFGFFHLDKKHKRTFLYLFACASSILLYLAFSQWLHNRISLPVMAFLLFWVSLHQEKKWGKGIQIALISFSLLYFSAYCYRDFQEKKRMEAAEESIALLNQNDPKLLAIWADSFPYEYIMRPFQENRKLLEEMSLLPLGMTVYTPFFEKKMKAHGFLDIHTALQDSNTLLVARPDLLPDYQVFMKEYYGKEISFQEVISQEEITLFIWKINFPNKNTSLP